LQFWQKLLEPKVKRVLKQSYFPAMHTDFPAMHIDFPAMHIDFTAMHIDFTEKALALYH
jgi:hypothetical protein